MQQTPTKKESDTKEFQRFEDLTRKLVNVPKKDIQEREKKGKATKASKK